MPSARSTQKSPQSRTFLGCSVFWSILTFVIAIVAIVMAIIGVYKGNDNEFKGLTNFESEYVLGEPEVFRSTFAVPCTNKTYGELEKTYMSETYLGFRCPETPNPCSINLCGSDGQCVEQTIEGGECHDSGQCSDGNMFYCDWSNCQCEPLIISSLCMNDTQCGSVDWTTCLQYYCIDGSCVQNFTMGSECATDDDCSQGETCQGCSCVAAPQCFVDGDCPVLLDTCSEFTCVSGECVEGLSPGATCSTDEQCVRDNGVGYGCNITSCDCYQQTSTACTIDSDCQSTNWTTCVEAVCNAGQCEEVLTMGSTCVTSSDCGTGQFCRGCTCADEIGNFTSFVPVITTFVPNEFTGMAITSAYYQVTGNYVSVWILGNGQPDGGDPLDGYTYRINIPFGTMNQLIGGVGTFSNPTYYGTFRLQPIGNAINFFGYLTYAPGTTSAQVYNNLYFVYELV